MALNLEDKKALVAEVAEVAAKAHSVVAAEYRGLTVGQMTELRSKARKSGVYVRVVKNTLARKALAGTSFEAVGPKLKGPLVLAFSKDDPGAAARVVKDFAKANEKFVPTLVSLGGQVLSAKDLDKVARRMADTGVAATVLTATDLYLGGRHTDHNVPRNVVDLNLDGKLDLVVVNGEIVARDGRPTDARPGTVIRAGNRH